jgi:nucleotide-binding universal stress UspA family protein
MGYVLVGIDGSDAARDALAWAGHAARRFELPLRIIHAYVQDISTQTGPAALRGATIHSGDPEPGGPRRHDRSRDVATHIIHEVLGHEAAEAAELLVVDGRPSDVLLRHARDAEMVVVGSRGIGGLGGRLLGSVSQRLAQEATCPVVIIRRPS